MVGVLMLLETTKTNGAGHVPEPVVVPDKSAVRTADPRDFSEVCRLLLLAHAEAGLFAPSNMKVAFHVDRFLRSPWKLPDGSSLLPVVDRLGNIDHGPRGIIGVLGHAGGPPRTLEGLVMLGMGSYWYTDEVHLDEYILYVDVGYRSFSHAKKLIEWQMHQAEINKMNLITGVLSNVDSQAKSELHGRFLNKVGEFFCWPGNFYSDILTGPNKNPRSALREAHIKEMKLKRELKKVQDELTTLTNGHGAA
jgi:hypothetical protein